MQIMREPKLRFVTEKAITELTKELNLVYNLEDYQDWEYIVGNENDIAKYIEHYMSLIDDDKRFALMEIILQALTDQNTEENLNKYWRIINPILQQNFLIHKYSIHYWSCFDNENIEDCWKITPFMRKLWQQNNVC
jgi:hypothetical protein